MTEAAHERVGGILQREQRAHAAIHHPVPRHIAHALLLLCRRRRGGVAIIVVRVGLATLERIGGDGGHGASHAPARAELGGAPPVAARPAAHKVRVRTGDSLCARTRGARRGRRRAVGPERARRGARTLCGAWRGVHAGGGPRPARKSVDARDAVRRTWQSHGRVANKACDSREPQKPTAPLTVPLPVVQLVTCGSQKPCARPLSATCSYRHIPMHGHDPERK